MSYAAIMERMGYRPKPFEPGHVWLAGAGPGGIGCLTVEVVAAIAGADAIVYDALVDPAVVEASEAELFYVGKRAGRPSSKQEDINRLLLTLARDGNRVLRLKGGDPNMFGRGGEEALALADAGIPFRFLPGVTSAVGALANAGIPATMRGVNKAVTLATGHAAAGSDEDLDWAALAQTGQPIVVYMGMNNLAAIAARLTEGGLPANTPAAVIMEATTDRERMIVADLGTIAEKAEDAGVGSPAIIVIGEIVRLRARLFGAIAAEQSS